MRNLLLGVALVVLIGFAGFFYRNAVEYSNQPIACPLDAKLCPDGTAVGRTGSACVFPACPPPNVTLAEADIAFAVPEGFVEVDASDPTIIAQYEVPNASSTLPSQVITIRRYAIASSSTALATIRETAIGGTSGLPVPATLFTSTLLGAYRFTIVNIDRFEAIIETAYYLARRNDVLRFDAIDRDVYNWTSPSLDVNTLPAHTALRKLLGTLQAE